MKTLFFAAILLASTFFKLAAFAQTTPAPAPVPPTEPPTAEAPALAPNEVRCISGSDNRILRKAAQGETGCKLFYTKSGTDTEVASQLNGTEKCDSVLAGIRGRLEAAGYKCQ